MKLFPINAIGWTQEPAVIEEDNLACVYASKTKHMTRSLQHLDLAELWFKEKVVDRICAVLEVDSKDNNFNVGTKRVFNLIFEYLTYSLIFKS